MGNRIQYLVSTMNKENEEFIHDMNIKDDVVIINQTNYDEEKIIKKNNQTIDFISVNEKGLSKSRNMAIDNSTADICVISDDDFIYRDDATKNILEAYKKYKDADIIAFHFYDKNRKKQKVHTKKSKRINYITALGICSAQITFKRESLKEKNIRFNEDFGAGADKYNFGEENIFLYECLQKGLKIYIEPIYILDIEKREEGSSWFKGFNKDYFIIKGTVHYQMTPLFYWVLNLQFAIRKKNRYKKDGITLFNAIYYMFKSSNEYRKKIRKKIYVEGDFVTDTGPGIVNKNYYPYIKEKCYICISNSKLKRIMHFLKNIRKCDVLLISGMSKFHIKSAKFAKKHNKKVIYLMHGYSRLEYGFNDTLENNKESLELEEELLQIVDKIICVSERFCEYLKNERKDLDNKLDFVNNGIEKMFDIEKNKKDNDIFTIISVGGGTPLKNILNICKAIENIENIEIKFIVIGSKAKLGEEIAKYKFVEYYEQLTHEEVIEKMKESDLYIQNSSFESFGLAVCEAISSGCKILISKNVGAISIIENLNENMIIENYEDIQEIENKIINMYERRNENIKYIENYNKYSWNTEARKILKICDLEITNENKR